MVDELKTPEPNKPTEERKTPWAAIVTTLVGGALGFVSGGFSGILFGLLGGVLGGIGLEALLINYGPKPTDPKADPKNAAAKKGDGKGEPDKDPSLRSTIAQGAQELLDKGSTITPGSPYAANDPGSAIIPGNSTNATLGVGALGLLLQRRYGQPIINGAFKYSGTNWIASKILGRQVEVGVRAGVVPGIWTTAEGKQQLAQEIQLKAKEAAVAYRTRAATNPSETPTEAEVRSVTRALKHSKAKALLGVDDMVIMRKMSNDYAAKNPGFFKRLWMDDRSGLEGPEEKPATETKAGTPEKPTASSGTPAIEEGDVIRIRADGRTEVVEPNAKDAGTRVRYVAPDGEVTTYIIDPEADIAKIAREVPELKPSIKEALIKEATAKIDATVEKMPNESGRAAAKAAAIESVTHAINTAIDEPTGPKETKVSNLQTEVAEIIKAKTGVEPVAEPAATAKGTPTPEATAKPTPAAEAAKPAAPKPPTPRLESKVVSGFDNAGMPIDKTTFAIRSADGKTTVAVEKVPASEGFGENIYRTSGDKPVYYTAEGDVARVVTPSKASFGFVDMGWLEGDGKETGQRVYEIKPMNETVGLDVTKVPVSEGLGEGVFRSKNDGRYFRIANENAPSQIPTEITQTAEVLQVKAMRGAGLANTDAVLKAVNETFTTHTDPAVKALRAQLTPEQMAKLAQSYDAALTEANKQGGTVKPEFLTEEALKIAAEPKAAAAAEAPANPAIEKPAAATTEKPAVAAETGKPAAPKKPTAPILRTKTVTAFMDGVGEPKVTSTYTLDMPDGKTQIIVDKVPVNEGFGDNVFRTRAPNVAERGAFGKGEIIKIGANGKTTVIKANPTTGMVDQANIPKEAGLRVSVPERGGNNPARNYLLDPKTNLAEYLKYPALNPDLKGDVRAAMIADAQATIDASLSKVPEGTLIEGKTAAEVKAATMDAATKMIDASLDGEGKTTTTPESHAKALAELVQTKTGHLTTGEKAPITHYTVGADGVAKPMTPSKAGFVKFEAGFFGSKDGKPTGESYEIKPMNETTSMEVTKVPPSEGLGEGVFRSKDGRYFKVANETAPAQEPVEITKSTEIRHYEAMRATTIQNDGVLKAISDGVAKDAKVKAMVAQLTPEQMAKLTQSYDAATTQAKANNTTVSDDFIAKKVQELAAEPKPIVEAPVELVKAETAKAAAKPAAPQPKLLATEITNIVGNGRTTTYSMMEPGKGTTIIPLDGVPLEEGKGQNIYRTRPAKAGDPVKYYKSNNGSLELIKEPTKGTFVSEKTFAGAESTITPPNENMSFNVKRAPANMGLGNDVFTNTTGTRYFRVHGEAHGNTVTEITNTPEVEQAREVLKIQDGETVLKKLNENETFRNSRAKMSPQQVSEVAASLVEAQKSGTAVTPELVTAKVNEVVAKTPAVAVEPAATGAPAAKGTGTGTPTTTTGTPAEVSTGTGATGEPVKAGPVVKPAPVGTATVVATGTTGTAATVGGKPNTWTSIKEGFKKINESTVNKNGVGYGMHGVSTFMGGFTIYNATGEYKRLEEQEQEAFAKGGQQSVDDLRNDPKYKERLSHANKDVAMGSAWTGIGVGGFGAEIASVRQYAAAANAAKTGMVAEEAAALSRAGKFGTASKGLGVAGGVLTIYQGGTRMYDAEKQDTNFGKQYEFYAGGVEAGAGVYFTAAAGATLFTTTAPGWAVAAGPVGVVFIGATIYATLVTDAIKDAERAATEFAVQGRRNVARKTHPSVLRDYGSYVTSKATSLPKMTAYGSLSNARNTINELARVTNTPDMWLNDDSSPEEIAKGIKWARGVIKDLQDNAIAENGFDRAEVMDNDRRATKMVDVQMPPGGWWIPIYGAIATKLDDTESSRRAKNKLSNALMYIDNSQLQLAAFEGAEKELFGVKEYVTADGKKYKGFVLEDEVERDVWKPRLVDPQHPEKGELLITSYEWNRKSAAENNKKYIAEIKQNIEIIKETSTPKMVLKPMILVPWAPAGGHKTTDEKGVVTGVTHGYEALGQVDLKYSPEALAKIEAFNVKAEAYRKRFDNLEKKVLAALDKTQRRAIEAQLIKEFNPNNLPMTDELKTGILNNELFKGRLAKSLREYEKRDGVMEDASMRESAVFFIINGDHANDKHNAAMIGDVALLKELEDYRIDISGDPKDTNPNKKKSLRQETVEFEQMLVQEQAAVNQKAFDELFAKAARTNIERNASLLRGIPDTSKAKTLKIDDAEGKTKLQTWLRKDEETRVLSKVYAKLNELKAQGKTNATYKDLGLEDRDLAIMYDLRKRTGQDVDKSTPLNPAGVVNEPVNFSNPYVFYRDMPAVLASADTAVSEDFIMKTLAANGRDGIVLQKQFLDHLEAKGIDDPNKAKFIEEVEKSQIAFVSWAADITDAAKTPQEREAIDRLIEMRLNLEKNYQTVGLAFGKNEWSDGSSTTKFDPLSYLYSGRVESSNELTDKMSMQKKYAEELNKLSPETAQKILVANAQFNLNSGHSDLFSDTLTLPTTDNILQMANNNHYRSTTDFRHKRIVIAGLPAFKGTSLEKHYEPTKEVTMATIGETAVLTSNVFSDTDRSAMIKLVREKYKLELGDAVNMVDKIALMFSGDEKQRTQAISLFENEMSYYRSSDVNSLATFTSKEIHDISLKEFYKEKNYNYNSEETYKTIKTNAYADAYKKFLAAKNLTDSSNAFYQFERAPEAHAIYAELQKGYYAEFMKTDPIQSGYSAFIKAKNYQNDMKSFSEYAKTPEFVAIVEKRAAEFEARYKAQDAAYKKAAEDFLKTPDMLALKRDADLYKEKIAAFKLNQKTPDEKALSAFINSAEMAALKRSGDHYSDLASNFYKTSNVPPANQDLWKMVSFRDSLKGFNGDDAAYTALVANYTALTADLSKMPEDLKLKQAKVFLGIATPEEAKTAGLKTDVQLTLKDDGRVIKGAVRHYEKNANQFSRERLAIPLFESDKDVARLTGIDPLLFKHSQVFSLSESSSDLKDFMQLGYTPSRMKLLTFMETKLVKERTDTNLEHVKEETDKKLVRLRAAIAEWSGPGKQVITGKTMIMDSSKKDYSRSHGYNTDHGPIVLGDPFKVGYTSVDDLAQKLLNTVKSNGANRYDFTILEKNDFGQMLEEQNSKKIPSVTMKAILKQADKKIQANLKYFLETRQKSLVNAAEPNIRGLNVTDMKAKLKDKEAAIDKQIADVKAKIEKTDKEYKEVSEKLKKLEETKKSPDEKIRLAAEKEYEELSAKANELDELKYNENNKLTSRFTSIKMVDGVEVSTEEESLENQKREILDQYNQEILDQQSQNLITEKSNAEKLVLSEMEALQQYRKEVKERYDLDLEADEQLITVNERQAMQTAAASSIIHMGMYIDDVQKFGLVKRTEGMTDEQFDNALFEYTKRNLNSYKMKDITRVLQRIAAENAGTGEFELTADQKKSMGTLARYIDRIAAEDKEPQLATDFREAVKKTFGQPDIFAQAAAETPVKTAMLVTEPTTFATLPTSPKEGEKPPESLAALMALMQGDEALLGGMFKPGLPDASIQKKQEKGQIS